MENKTEIQMIDWFDDHWYKITTELGEDYFPSVTTKLNIIAKPFLARWRGDIGNREADLRISESQDRGVRIHNAWYTLTTKGAVVYNPHKNPNYSSEQLDALNLQYAGNIAVIKYQDEMFDVWKLQKWMEIVKPLSVKSEQPVFSIKNRDAGTMDNLMEIAGGKYQINGSTALELPAGLYVVDLKTGKQIDDNAFLQTAAYAKCAEEMGLGEIQGTLILHTGATTKKGIEGLATSYRMKEEMEQDYLDYRLAAALWERKNSEARPKIFQFPSILTLKENENVTQAMG